KVGAYPVDPKDSTRNLNRLTGRVIWHRPKFVSSNPEALPNSQMLVSFRYPAEPFTLASKARSRPRIGNGKSAWRLKSHTPGPWEDPGRSLTLGRLPIPILFLSL